MCYYANAGNLRNKDSGTGLFEPEQRDGYTCIKNLVEGKQSKGHYIR